MKSRGSGASPHHRTRGWGAALLSVAFVVGVGGGTARAANPFTATYSQERESIFWILHISDPHIGASAIEGPNASEHLAWALGEAIDVIDPAFVVDTGDLVDGSINGIPATGQSQEEWDDYAGMVAEAGLEPDFYLDLAGNHDGYGDIGLTYYLNNSLNGVYAGAPYREVWLSFPFGDYLLYGVNTAGNGSDIFVEAPAYTEDQVAALTAALDPSEAAELVLLFGHHRITRPDNSAVVVTLANNNGAFWFHGHEHEYGSYIEEGVVSAQVDCLGKKDTDNLAVIAVDHNSVSYMATSSEEPWPLVVVTAPADSRLDSGDANPYAYEVCTTGTRNPVRALVFDAAVVTAVSFTAGGAAPVAMTQDADNPRLWYGEWDTTGLPVGETQLTVAAEGTNVHASTITVRLADVRCPDAPAAENPDAGPSDGGAGADGGGKADAGPKPDAGRGGDGGFAANDDGGCGCGASGGSGAPLAGLVVLWLFAARLRRQRRAHF